MRGSRGDDKRKDSYKNACKEKKRRGKKEVRESWETEDGRMLLDFVFDD